ncbi:MAG: DUF3301 domain-containing protein [Gallionellaceae bacterium]|jgi:hypothetical protein
MDYLSTFGLFILAALGWFWLSSISVLELARNAAMKACADAEVQFLDDTVARVGLNLSRDESGRRVFRRIYRFEFSETGNTRIEGQVIMLGYAVESVAMDPYLMLG